MMTDKVRGRSMEGETEQADNLLYLDLAGGRVVLRLRTDLAPNHVERIKHLTRQGFYNGLLFHRVIDGFMAQTGDPTGTGRGGSSLQNLKAEFTDTPFHRGAVGMARSAREDSANSQFFICYDDARWLDGQYTLFAEVIEGMEHVDALPRGEPPASPGTIIRAQLSADARK
jgi:peptidylprolyl isomerase